MTLTEAMQQRHSVRSYLEKPLEESVKNDLLAMIEECNRESGLHIQLICDEPKAFKSFLAHYGKFSGISNYIALIGPDTPALEETCGYYGEKLVLRAQQLGLNTCWVALTYKKVKTAFTVLPGEKLLMVISLGYGANQGVPHSSKELSAVCAPTEGAPEWFYRGVEAALLAPTAVNQQQFFFTCEGSTVKAEARRGFYAETDLGIAKYHFEIGAGTENFEWAK